MTTLSKTTKARLVTAVTQTANAAIAYGVFDSKASAAYHLAVGAYLIPNTDVPENMQYDTTDMAIHGASMMVGGVISTAIISGMTNFFLGSTDAEEIDSDEIDEVITSVTGLEAPEQA